MNSNVCFEVVGVCSFVCRNCVCKSGLFPSKNLSQMKYFNKTREEFKAVFPRLIPLVLVVQFTVQMAKLKGLADLPKVYF